MQTPDYIKVNKELWNGKTPHHVKSSFYNMAPFLAGATSLNDIELGLLGDVKGKTILHLQCHFGKDSLSLARMGAKVTGIDFSEEAIAKARELNTELGLDAEFICSDVYSLGDVLTRQFDIIYTSYGVICWLPDMGKWAGIVRQFLKPGGHFVFVEFHPAVWMFDDEYKFVKYGYFNGGPIIETPAGTYADFNASIQLQEITWNHHLGEVLGALLDQQLQLLSFTEYDSSPYPCFPEITECAPGRYQIKGLEGKIPMVYALKMRAQTV